MDGPLHVSDVMSGDLGDGVVLVSGDKYRIDRFLISVEEGTKTKWEFLISAHVRLDKDMHARMSDDTMHDI